MPHGAGASRRPYIELSRRRVYLAGITANPDGAWVTQQARHLSFTGVFERMRFLIHDRDSTFTASFDEVCRSAGIKVIHTPIRARKQTPTPSASSARSAPNASTGCGSSAATSARVNRPLQPRTPPRALALHLPEPATTFQRPNAGAIDRRDLLGGLIHEYHRAAA